MYSTRFPTEIGYQCYSSPPKADLLLLRLEDLARVINRALGTFLGIEDFVLYPYNIGEEKDYAELYKVFKATRLPASYVEEVYRSKFARHSYAAEERETFTRKWTHSG